MNYYIIFTTEDRKVFVSKKEDLENIDKCVNVSEGIDRAPAFHTYESAERRYDQFVEHLEKEGQQGYGFFRLVPLNEIIKEIRLSAGSLGDFGDVKIEGKDVTLTRFNEDDEDEDRYIPRVYASIVDGVLYIAKDIDTGEDYDTRIVWASNQFTVTIKEAEENDNASQGV